MAGLVAVASVSGTVRDEAQLMVKVLKNSESCG
jgi:hypothetical protein